jgi:hypothetical protein
MFPSKIAGLGKGVLGKSHVLANARALGVANRDYHYYLNLR